MPPTPLHLAAREDGAVETRAEEVGGRVLTFLEGVERKPEAHFLFVELEAMIGGASREWTVAEPAASGVSGPFFEG